MGPALECDWYTQWHSIKANWFFHPQKSSAANSFFLVNGGTLPTALEVLGIFLIGITTGLLNALTVSAISYVYQSYCSWKMLSLVLSIIPPPFPHRSMSLEERGLLKTFHLVLSTPKSLTLCTLPSCYHSLFFFSISQYTVWTTCLKSKPPSNVLTIYARPIPLSSVWSIFWCSYHKTQWQDLKPTILIIEKQLHTSCVFI